MKRIITAISNSLAPIIMLAVAGLIVTFMIIGKPAEDGSITLDGSKAKIPEYVDEFIKNAQIVMSEQSKRALITLDGKTEEADLPTIESIDSSRSTKDEHSEVGGRGWFVDTSSPAAFRNATNGRCIDTDGAYGSQCWDLGNLFWQNYAGRSLNTCGTGAAKGTIYNGCWQKNAGDQFDMVWDKTKIQAGDWIIFGGGQWGHVGMAVGGYNNGYVALFGTNQGGAACAGGGSSANTVNMSLGNFMGAFRPKKYTVATAAAAPSVSAAPKQSTIHRAQPSGSHTVRAGDTLGDIALRNGWHGASGLFGDAGYAQRLAEFNGIKNRGLIHPNQVIRRAH